jgi:hypothetical protein
MTHAIQNCPGCRMRVAPKTSGKCPGCGMQLTEPLPESEHSLAGGMLRHTAKPPVGLSPRLLEETDTPKTPAGQLILERDRKHSGSFALLAIAGVNLLAALFLSINWSNDGAMTMLWISVLSWCGLYAYSFSDPLSATGVGIVIAILGVAINQATGHQNSGFSMLYLAMLASSHAGHRRRARTGTGRQFLVRALCEAEVISSLRPQELGGLIEQALGSNATVIARHHQWAIWHSTFVVGQVVQDFVVSLSLHKGLTSVAVRSFVSREMASEAEKHAMNLVQSLVHAANQVPGATGSQPTVENRVQPEAQVAPSAGKASAREPEPTEFSGAELVPATAAADEILDSLGRPSPTRAWLWTLLTLLVAIKLGVEAALLWAPNLGIAVSPGLLGEIVLFPHIYGFSFLPLVYGSGIPGPGFVILFLTCSRCRQHWLEFTQKQSIRSRRFALYLRSFCDDPEKPDAWQLAVNQLSLAAGGGATIRASRMAPRLKYSWSWPCFVSGSERSQSGARPTKASGLEPSAWRYPTTPGSLASTA